MALTLISAVSFATEPTAEPPTVAHDDPSGEPCAEILAPRGRNGPLDEVFQRMVDEAWRATADVSDNPLIRWANVRIDSWVLEHELDILSFVSAQRMAGYHLDARDSHGRTALMHAAHNGKHDLTWALLRNGAHVDLYSDAFRTAADYAKIRRPQPGTHELEYVQRYLSLDGKYVGDEVWAAMRNPDLTALESLMRRGVFVDFFDLNLGKSLLTFAAEAGDLPRMRLLLDHGANPRFRMRNGDGPYYPLPAAAAACQREAVQLLLDHGASINDGGFYSYELNPVIQIIWDYSQHASDHLDKLGMLEWLLSKGADPDANVDTAPIKNAQTAAQLLQTQYGREPERKAQVIALLRKYGKYNGPTLH